MHSGLSTPPRDPPRPCRGSFASRMFILHFYLGCSFQWNLILFISQFNLQLGIGWVTSHFIFTLYFLHFLYVCDAACLHCAYLWHFYLGCSFQWHLILFISQFNLQLVREWVTFHFILPLYVLNFLFNNNFNIILLSFPLHFDCSIKSHGWLWPLALKSQLENELRVLLQERVWKFVVDECRSERQSDWKSRFVLVGELAVVMFFAPSSVCN